MMWSKLIVQNTALGCQGTIKHYPFHKNFTIRKTTFVLSLTIFWKIMAFFFYFCILNQTKISIWSQLSCLETGSYSVHFILWIRYASVNLFTKGLILLSGLPATLPRRFILWSWRPTLLWDSLPRQTRIPMRRMSQTNHRAMHHSYVQEIPPRALCLCLLP